MTLNGGLTFAGVNGVMRGAYATNLTNIAPRFGAAYAFTDRTSVRFGFGEFFVNDETTNGNGGFSSTTNYTNSLDNGLTPYGHLSDPFSSFVQPVGCIGGACDRCRWRHQLRQSQLPYSVRVAVQCVGRATAYQTRYDRHQLFLDPCARAAGQ